MFFPIAAMFFVLLFVLSFTSSESERARERFSPCTDARVSLGEVGVCEETRAPIVVAGELLRARAVGERVVELEQQREPVFR